MYQGTFIQDSYRNSRSFTIKKSVPFVLAVIMIFSAAFAFTGCTGSNAITLSGSIESTQIDVNSEVAGKILKMEKDEGMAVKKDDVIAVVDSSVQELAVKQQESIVKLKQAKLDELKAGTRPEQVKQAQAAADAAGTAVNTARTGVDTAQINYNYWVDKLNKTKSLLDSSAVSENELTDMQYKVDTAREQLQTAQKQLSAAQSQSESAQAQLELLKNGSTNQTIQAAQADLEQSQAALDQSKLVLGKYQVKSPIDGTYLFKNANIGDMVNAGTSIATVSDLRDLWVSFYIPQRNLNTIKLNQELNLTSIALPGKKVKGKVIFISDEAEYTPKNTETNEAKENTVFKVKVKILDNLDSLKPGMTVEARIPVQ